jgi:HPt (histidine-containing phosphotransfer) domain-containing protein
MSSVIDWDKVRELRGEVGEEDFDEVFELFLEEVDETISQLGKPDRSLEHDLHFLKGAALNLGFKDFSQLCRDGETACATDASTKIDTDAIISCYATSKAQFIADMPAQLT